MPYVDKLAVYDLPPLLCNRGRVNVLRSVAAPQLCEAFGGCSMRVSSRAATSNPNSPIKGYAFEVIRFDLHRASQWHVIGKAVIGFAQAFVCRTCFFRFIFRNLRRFHLTFVVKWDGGVREVVGDEVSVGSGVQRW